MGAGKRHETTGSVTRGFITHRTASSISLIVTLVPLTLKSHEHDTAARVDAVHTVGFW